MSAPHPEIPMLIPGDAIETSPEWVSATRRAFPLLPDAVIREGFDDLREANRIYEELLDLEVDAEAEAEAAA